MAISQLCENERRANKLVATKAIIARNLALRDIEDAVDYHAGEVGSHVASGYVEDQRWTLVRVVALIATMFHIRYSLKGASLLLHRMGWPPQMPSHRAAERDEDAIASWRRHRWPAVKGPRAGWVRGSASPTRRDKR